MKLNNYTFRLFKIAHLRTRQLYELLISHKLWMGMGMGNCIFPLSSVSSCMCPVRPFREKVRFTFAFTCGIEFN